MLVKGFKWTRHLVVLCNVGLLYFKNSNEPPVDLFPILDCVLHEVDPEHFDGETTVFKLEAGRK